MELIEKFVNTKEDVLYYTAKEAGITTEQMQFIEIDLWKAIAFYINNPHMIKGDKIDLESFIRFKLRTHANIVKKAKRSLKYLEEMPNPQESDLKDIERYKLIIKQFDTENG